MSPSVVASRKECKHIVEEIFKKIRRPEFPEKNSLFPTTPPIMPKTSNRENNHDGGA
jgi:hypothetical protein